MSGLVEAFDRHAHALIDPMVGCLGDGGRQPNAEIVSPPFEIEHCYGHMSFP